MIWDAQNQPSDAQVLAASAPSTNVIRFTKPDGYIHDGTGQRVLVWLDAPAKDSDGDETYKIKLETDDQATFFSPTPVGAEVTIPRGSVLGSKFFVEIPSGSHIQEFIRLYFTLGGTDPEVTVSAVLLPANMSGDDASQFFYPIGYRIEP